MGLILDRPVNFPGQCAVKSMRLSCLAARFRAR
jgi:hypothetical protein